MASKIFSLYDADKLLRQAGAERVDEKASKKLCELLEDSGKEIMLKARVYARHAGRKQITREDVLLAAGMLQDSTKKIF